MSSNSFVLLRGLSRCRAFASPHTRLKATRCASSYSAYEYPLAKEAPDITRTKAEETVKKPRSGQRTAPRPHEDRFDDAHVLTPQQIEEIRSEQRTNLNTSLSSAYAITKEVPASIPPNFPADQLDVPETLVTILDNGIRVVSQETYGQVSTVGAVCEVGSRLERPDEMGVTNLIDVLAFGATNKYSGPQVNTLLQDWGGQRFVSTGREQSLHCVDLLRPNVENALDLLQEVLLEARFLPEEVEDAKLTLGFQAMDMLPEFLLGEALQQAAYGTDQQLGQPHFCPAGALSQLSADTVHNYWRRQFIQNPKGMVIGGAGVRHDFLVRKVEELFGHLEQNDQGRSSTIPSQYRGGEKRVQHSTVDGLVRIGVGFEVGGWHSDTLVATCVLQTLLGGGSSFSAGGPGKGMYSRLYRRVLNQFGWAESAEAYTAFHNESGIWGISGSTLPENARNMVQVFTHHLAQLAVNHVSDEELDRARNMLKCNVLTQLESRLVLFEDMGRQVLTYGHRENMNVTCEKIDAVTKEDLRQVAMKALEKPPSLASVGSDLSQMPHHDEVVAWLG